MGGNLDSYVKRRPKEGRVVPQAQFLGLKGWFVLSGGRRQAELYLIDS